MIHAIMSQHFSTSVRRFRTTSITAQAITKADVGAMMSTGNADVVSHAPVLPFTF